MHVQAERIARQLPDARLLNHVFFNLCADYRHLRQYEKAEKYGSLALAGFEQQNAEDKWKAITLNELGMIAHLQMDLPLARQRLETAAALHRRNGQPSYSEAEVAFRRANSPYLQRSSHTYYRALVWHCLGLTLLKQDRLEEAERCLRESADLWSVANDGLMLANTLGALGELYNAKNQSALATTYLDRAMQHLDGYPDDATAVRLKAEFLALKASLNEK